MKRHYREDYNQNPHNYINYEEGVIRVLCHAEPPAGDPIHRQCWLQDGTLLNVVRNEVWIFLCKN